MTSAPPLLTYSALIALGVMVILMVIGRWQGRGAGTTPDTAGSLGRMADAIYWAEGGANTRFPYGVKLYRNGVAVAAERPREMCLLILEARWREWFGKGTGKTFTEFVAGTYCPVAADPAGHKNWIDNVNYFIRKPRPITR